MLESCMGNYLEEFETGKIIKHQLSKTIFESDNNLFSLLTMNHHPLHTNRDFAEKSQHGQILVVGTLVFSIVVGMTVPDISGKAIANLEYEKVEHLAPVFINDTIYAESEILVLALLKIKWGEWGKFPQIRKVIIEEMLRLALILVLIEEH